MKLLLDAHTLLWWLNNSPLLSPIAREAITNKNNLVLVSIATIWEIHIKHGIGRLAIPDDFHQNLIRQEIKIVDIKLSHLAAYSKLELIHRDPFDRILIVQAQVEDLTVVTRDRDIQKYRISILKA